MNSHWNIAMFIHLFIVCGCCFTTKVELNNSKEIPWPAKPKMFTVPLYRKFADHCSDRSLWKIMCIQCSFSSDMFKIVFL